jgi:hypothetical protein
MKWPGGTRPAPGVRLHLEGAPELERIISKCLDREQLARTGDEDSLALAAPGSPAFRLSGIVQLRPVEYDATKRVLAAFEREGVRYVIFGAAALNLLGLARFTEDLDVFIQAERENVDRLKRALTSVFADPHIDEIRADDLLGDYPAVQYVPPEGTFHIDILTRLGEAFRFEDLQAQRVPFEDLTVSVATPATLYRMKRNTVRLRDKADAELLKERFDLED